MTTRSAPVNSISTSVQKTRWHFWSCFRVLLWDKPLKRGKKPYALKVTHLCCLCRTSVWSCTVPCRLIVLISCFCFGAWFMAVSSLRKLNKAVWENTHNNGLYNQRSLKAASQGVRCSKKSTTFWIHLCQPLLSQTAASSFSLHHHLCLFLFLPLKQPERGGLSWPFSAAKTGVAGPPQVQRHPRGLPWLCTACLWALSLPPCFASFPGQESAAAHASSLHLAGSGCHQSGTAQPMRKLAGLGLGGTCLSPGGLHKCLSCCCQVRKTGPFSQGQAASVAVAYVY